MQKQTTEPTVESSPTWERLETWLRSRLRVRMHELYQGLTEESA
jgi:hypothetical protein